MASVDLLIRRRHVAMLDLGNELNAVAQALSIDLPEKPAVRQPDPMHQQVAQTEYQLAIIRAIRMKVAPNAEVKPTIVASAPTQGPVDLPPGTALPSSSVTVDMSKQYAGRPLSEYRDAAVEAKDRQDLRRKILKFRGVTSAMAKEIEKDLYAAKVIPLGEGG